LRGELMNFFPEIATRFRIDTGGWFVQQQQFRAMNEAGGEREALFPAAGKLAGELLFALGQPEFLDAFAYCLPPILHPVHARDKIEILLNAQILPKTESLRHVTNFSFGRFTFGNHIVTQDPAAPVVGAEQSAKHAQKRGLAAAVRTEKPINFARAHR
jgi:hypothetical protein